ncbi:MAG: VOC family protein [Alphaproteobacteria bacterium]|jgi:catechol 2,3-dioxygenase
MTRPPLWPAHLHHFCLRTDQPDAMRGWYEKHLEMNSETVDGGEIWLSAGQRNIVLQPAETRGIAYAAYALADAEQSAKFDADMREKGAPLSDLRSPVFTDDQTAVLDPDGNTFIFGVPARPEAADPDPMPGRLQHLGICTPQIDKLIEFYTGTIGYRQSDIVKKDDGHTAACFLRSDHEHHCLALFSASTSRFDHQCYESTCWNDIRDWGDHFASMRTEIEWGAARHGAGNNLFIFVRDPDHNPVEISAELETVDFDKTPGLWKAEDRTLNLWGHAWKRE